MEEDEKPKQTRKYNGTMKKGVWVLAGVDENLVREEKVPNGSRHPWKHRYRTDQDQRQVCGAKLRGLPGRRCAYWNKLYPNGRCRYHSGKSSTGALTVARAMRAVGPLKNAKDRAKEDVGLLDLRPGVALFDERMHDLSGRMFEHGDSPDWRKRAVAIFGEMVRARRAKDEMEQLEQEARLKAHLTEGVKEDTAWTELLKLQERRSERAEKAGGLLVKSSQVIVWRELMMVLDRVVKVIEEEVPSGSRTRVLDRLDKEVLSIGPEEKGSAAETGCEVLPGVQGPGAGVREGGAGGEALGVPAGRAEGAVRASEGDGADSARAGQDEDGGGRGADVHGDAQGRGGDHDGTDGPPSQEPAVG